MVRLVMLGSLLLAAMAPASAERLLTVDELRQLAGDADRVHREKRARIQGGDLSQLLPQVQREDGTAPPSKVSKEIATPPVPDAVVIQTQESPRVTKYSKPKAIRSRRETERTVSSPESAAEAAPEPASAKVNPFEYVPPPRTRATDETVYTDAVIVDELEYGIRIGTWIDVEMLRNISSAEPGMVAFRVDQPVAGRYRTLEAGTELFAEKIFNGATQRLELMVTRGVTSYGEEFAIRGQVYDMQKVSGLDGIVKKKALVKGSVQSGLLAATRTALGMVAQEGPVGAGAVTAADVVISEGEGAVAEQLQDEYVIYVSSREARLFITEAF